MLVSQPANRPSRRHVAEIRGSLALALSTLTAAVILSYSDRSQITQNEPSQPQLPAVGMFLPELEFAPTETDGFAASMTSGEPKLTPTSATISPPQSSKYGVSNETDHSTGNKR